MLMKVFQNEKYLRIAFLSFGIAAIAASILHLITGLGVPGVEPIVSAAFWFFFWRWNKLRGKHPGGIYSFFYLLIISMNLYSGFTQIWLAIA